MDRISWDELFMGQSRIYAHRSACLLYQVGAVFEKNNRVVSGGYNGPPRGEPNCNEVGCAKLDEHGNRLSAGSFRCRGAHAEMNAIVNAGAETGGLAHSKLYCTFSPCLDCAKHLINLPITELVYEIKYHEKEGGKALALLRRRGIKVRKFESRKEE